MSGSHHQSQVLSDDFHSGCRNINVTTNSPSQDLTHPDDHILLTDDISPGYKPFYSLVLLLE